MNYVIECRSSRALINFLSGDEQLRSMGELLHGAVFFASNISCEDGPDRETTEQAAEEILHQATKEAGPTLIVERDFIDVRESSVVLIFYVSPLLSHPEPATAAAVVGLGSLALWVLPRLWDAVLDKFFKSLVDQTTERIARWWRDREKNRRRSKWSIRLRSRTLKRCVALKSTAAYLRCCRAVLLSALTVTGMCINSRAAPRRGSRSLWIHKPKRRRRSRCGDPDQGRGNTISALKTLPSRAYEFVIVPVRPLCLTMTGVGASDRNSWPCR
jgi:hypothetical protein